MHSLLRRQLERCGIDDPDQPPSASAWSALVQRVARTYKQADEERYLMERSLGLSSAEMLELAASLRASEASLAAERDKLQAVFASLGDGLFVLDAEARCRMANPAAERILWWSAEELHGARVLDLIGAAGIATSALREPIRNDDSEFVRRDGAVVPVSFTLNPILRDDQLHGVVLAFRDISERKQVERVLEGERRQLLEIIAHAPVPIAMFDCDMRYLACSERWLSDYGLVREQTIGKSHYDVFRDIPERWKEIHRRCLEGEFASNSEDTFERADGSRLYLRWAVQPWYAHDGAIGGIVMVADRIDDLVKAREAALDTARLKAEFLANMSHEIRTPMNGVIGMTELLLATPLKSDQREFADTIRVSAENLLTIINDILDFSKIEAGKLALESVEFDPRSVVYEVTDMLAEQAQRKDLEIAALIHHDIPRQLCGDPGRLRQVLINLMSNAVKFTERGEIVVTLTLAARGEDEVVLRFEVQDTGVGIAPSATARLFQAFSQADGSTTRRYGGTGLGLAISRQLTELMGGEIGVTSEPHVGSTFWFTARLRRALGDEAPVVHTLSKLEGVRALIVDDNGTNRRILEAQTTRWGMRVVSVDGSISALRELQEAAKNGLRYEIGLIDMGMPDMDGFQLARAIRADPALADMKLVLLTSMLQRSQVSDVSSVGFNAFLVKPIHEAKLLECVQAVIANHRVDARKAPERLVTPESLSATARRQRPRVLLAEDNAVNRKVAVRMLERFGCNVDVAANGQEAVEACQGKTYALILMDCQMPDLDGLAATRMIREMENEKRTPIIALTAHALPGDRERCIEAGMDDHVPKPIKSEDLARALARWLPARCVEGSSPCS